MRKRSKQAIVITVFILFALGMGLLLVRFLFPATSEEVERNETPALSRNEVQVIRIEDTGSIGIAEAVPVADAALSENTAAEESAGEAETVSEDEVPAVSEDEAVSENEAAPEEEAPEEEEPVDEDLPADTAAPIVLAVNAAPTIKIGDTFDVHKYIGYADDVDRHVEMEVSGEVNTAAEGTYPLQITLRDDAGHSTSQKMTVKVVTEFPPSTGYVGKTEAFSDFINTYKTENTSVGIDISRWQEDVDFEKVKAAGCEFVYMRIGGLDEGELYTDRYYEYNIAAAKAAGLKVGIYWHAEEGNARQVKASVDYLMTVLNGQELDFPIAYDWEDFMRFENHEMNLYDLNNNLDVFVSEVEKHGYTGCLYNSKYYLDTVWTSASKHPVWLAYYVSSLSDHSRYFMWQHGCTGRIDGVNGDVDLDVLYHDVPMQ